MRRAGLLLACAAVLGAGAVARTAGAAPARAPSALVVAAEPGHVQAAVKAIRRAGARVTTRRGRLLQVRASRAAAARLRRAPAVAALGPAQVPYADAFVSQGVYRTGADALLSSGTTGKGVRVAILDLG